MNAIHQTTRSSSKGSVILCGLILFGALTSFHSENLRADEPHWEEGTPIPLTGRANPYGFEEEEWKFRVERGRRHALEYPVEVTGTLIPERALVEIFNPFGARDLRTWFLKGIHELAGLGSADDLFRWMGLHPFPEEGERGIYAVPAPRDPVLHSYRMGLGRIHRYGATGLTVSCAGCHSANLFGKKVLGLTNRFPRANAFFWAGKKGTVALPPALFQRLSHATEGETQLYRDLHDRLGRIGVRVPLEIGLDTSLAHVALSMARRAPDEDATPDPRWEKSPRPDPLDHVPADSKPAPWWNVKYKNRWLLDGTVVSGNPILTNLVWNEIGRGADLVELRQWLLENDETIQDLTSAVFASEAPSFTDFFPAEQISRDRALRGEKIFQERCEKCHGTYVKVWSLPKASGLPWVEQLKTEEVRYHEETPVVNVGTDPYRNQGMFSLARALNPLRVSKENGILIKVEKPGYIPPPLVGIWARWPYFHNNSAPSLCAVLTPGKERPTRYWAGEALDSTRDFDKECNGYPLGEDVPRTWKRKLGRLYKANRPGTGNQGHDEGIFVKNGQNLLSEKDRGDLIQFLQTL